MSDQLKSWYEVAIPHKDIREGRLDEAVFAANLWAVVQGEAPDIYLDTEEFFKKTFLTSGLSTILKRVSQALKGDSDSGDRIISLQTAFGGGKTHILVALWHFAKYLDTIRTSDATTDIRDIVGDDIPDSVKSVAVFTNETCDPTQGRKTPEGVHTKTLWGELAFQLGGNDLYKKVEENDQTQRAPLGIFVDVLKEAAPCLILLDELADYCVSAMGVPVGDSHLADQTISFINQLTQAVHQVPGAVLLATLPASKYEVAQSESGQEIFMMLEKRFQRLGADVKPVSDEEICDVVRSRLFESIDGSNGSEYPKKVAKVYQEMYSSHENELPNESSKATYREQIERAYPFHPILIDTLYTRWGSNPSFQRTRGVLRLLASIVGDLWKRRDTNSQTQHFIQPCHINWSVDAMQAILTRLWDQAFQSVAAADIIGDRSNAGQLDDERGSEYLNEAIAKGLASAILLGSFGGQSDRSGFSSKELKLACSRHGLNWNYTDGALLELGDRCFYLHSTAAGSQGKRYWFGTKPNLTRLIVDYRQRVSGEDFHEEILEDLKNESQQDSSYGATWRIVFDPSGDLPEQKSLALLIFGPSLQWDEKNHGSDLIKKKVLEISNSCGGRERIYRNTLVYLAGTAGGISKLRQNHREYEALRSLKSDYWDGLDSEQKEELQKRLEAARKSSLESIGSAFTVLLRVAGQEVEQTSIQNPGRTFREHLKAIWEHLLNEEEWILRKVGSVTLANTGLIPSDSAISLKNAVEAFLRFTDKPMISSREAVTVGLNQACKDGIVGIARGTNPSELHASYCNEEVVLDPNEEGVWIIPPFIKGVGEEKPESGEVREDIPGADEGGTRPREKEDVVEEVHLGPIVKKFSISGTITVENWGELFRCFVAPSVQMNLKRTKLGIQFEMETYDNQRIHRSDSTIKSIEEAANQLGLKFEVEEEPSD